MDIWGCEFIDDGGNHKPPPSSKDRVFYLPMELMADLVDQKYQKEMRIRDKERLQALTVNIARHGILVPAKIHYSENLIRLYDGNHRYYCAKQLKLETFPVQFVHVPKMQNKTGSSLLHAFNFLLSELQKS